MELWLGIWGLGSRAWSPWLGNRFWERRLGILGSKNWALGATVRSGPHHQLRKLQSQLGRRQACHPGRACLKEFGILQSISQILYENLVEKPMVEKHEQLIKFAGPLPKACLITRNVFLISTITIFSTLSVKHLQSQPTQTVILE